MNEMMEQELIAKIKEINVSNRNKLVNILSKLKRKYKLLAKGLEIYIYESDRQDLFIILDYVPNILKHDLEFLKQCLSLRKFNLIEYFDESVFTEDIINEYGDKLLDNLRVIPYTLKKNNYLFQKCLSSADKKMLFQFDNSFFTSDIITDDVIDKYGEELITHFKGIPENFLTNRHFFQKCLELSKTDLLYQFKFEASIINDSDSIEYYANVLGISPLELSDKLKYLYQKNDDVFDTLKILMLSKDVSIIDIKNIEKFAPYSSIQLGILNLDKTSKNVFSQILNYLDFSIYDVAPFISDMLENYHHYGELISSVGDKKLSSEVLNNLTQILQLNDYDYGFWYMRLWDNSGEGPGDAHSLNYYNITDINQLTDKEFSNIKRKKELDIIEHLKDNSINIDELKQAVLIKKFGITIDQAVSICNRFCHALDSLEESSISSRTKKVLKELYFVNSVNDYNILKFLYLTSKEKIDNFCYSFVLESVIRGEYARVYSDSLYKVKDSHKMQRGVNVSDEEYKVLNSAEYDGKRPDIYIMDGDFNMQIHTLGAYAVEYEVPDNFRQDWEKPKIASHAICTTYIGNNQIAIARQRHPAIAFDHYEDSALLLMDNHDINSAAANLEYDPTKQKMSKYYDPVTLINTTRHTHNEMTIERRNNMGDGSFKRMPDYVVYFVDDLGNIKDRVNDDIFAETVQAAIDFDVPMVIVDRLKYAKLERNKIDRVIDLFKEKPNIRDLKYIINNYCNNMVGCACYDEKHRCSYHDVFSDKDLQDIINDLYSYISNIDDSKLVDIKREEALIQLSRLIDVENDSELNVKVSFPARSKERLMLNYIASHYDLQNDTDFTILDVGDIASYYLDADDEVRSRIDRDLGVLSLREIIDKCYNDEYEKENSFGKK